MSFRRVMGLHEVAVVAVLTALSYGQDTPNTLLRFQRSKAELSLETNVVHAQGMQGITYGKSGDVSSYPNTLSCLLVNADGKYTLEKRDESTVGKPKVKLAEGTLSADDLQRLKAILDDEGLKKIVTPKPPALPDNAQAVREIDSIDAEIERPGKTQRITTIKERIKMSATETGGATNGMDTYIDNAAPFQKTLNPLIKWFESLEKKSKSEFKEAKPHYCAPLNIG